MKKNELETKARMMNTCPICGASKNSGEHAQIVCWGECWRGDNGLKFSELEAKDWLKENWGRDINN